MNATNAAYRSTRCAVEVLPWPDGIPIRSVTRRCPDRTTAGHAAHDGERLIGCAPSVFAGSRLADAQFGMLAALPVDAPRTTLTQPPRLDIDHDLGDQRLHQRWAGSHRARGAFDAAERSSAIGEVGESHHRQHRTSHRSSRSGNARHARANTSKAFSSCAAHQTVVGIGSGIAAQASDGSTDWACSASSGDAMAGPGPRLRETARSGAHDRHRRYGAASRPRRSRHTRSPATVKQRRLPTWKIGPSAPVEPAASATRVDMGISRRPQREQLNQDLPAARARPASGLSYRRPCQRRCRRGASRPRRNSAQLIQPSRTTWMKNFHVPDRFAGWS